MFCYTCYKIKHKEGGRKGREREGGREGEREEEDNEKTKRENRIHSISVSLV